MVTQGVKRELNGVRSTELKGYNCLLGADEVANVHTLKSYREVTDTFVDALGDAALAEPKSMVDKGPLEARRGIYDAIVIGSDS